MTLYIVYETDRHTGLKIWGTAYLSFEKALAAVSEKIAEVNAEPWVNEEAPGQMDEYDIKKVAEDISVAYIDEGRVQFFIKALTV